MFTRILIANRGEIACRVATTARRLGITTVAVYSDADVGAGHVACCDHAIRIGPAPAQESYLCADNIIAAALTGGVQAIHPGYGFLSENPAFAERCAAAGLVFIGPPASAMRAMGSKSAAKTRMEQAQVPLLPGYHGDCQEAGFLQEQAARIGYPVLLKATAGGGGKGMRIVEHAQQFEAALASCQREARNSFGDERVLLEKYLVRSRHIEIQVFADTHGECISLFERDCSVQRRHQKVLEEAPAPGMTQARRSAMGEAAVAAAKAVGYVGAGTVEFIVDVPSDGTEGTFYFMEMNTRLQVEHPVTEMITGLDLVEWQLRVAFDEPLPRRQEELTLHGHAIEARIYAENPASGFLPSIGTLDYVRTPPAVAFDWRATTMTDVPATVRIDSGVREGDAISPFYDPMIAKLIVWGKDRPEALQRMAHALAAYRIVGVTTNIAFLKRIVESVPFAGAMMDTGLIEQYHDALFPPVQPASIQVLALAVAALLRSEHDALSTGSDPWGNPHGWRMNGVLRRRIDFTDDAVSHVLEVDYQESGWLLHYRDLPVLLQCRPADARDDASILFIRLGNETFSGAVVRKNDLFHVFFAGTHVTLVYHDPLASAAPVENESGRLTAPMPGKIIALLVKAGDMVKQGTPLLIMEAMKMEHTIAAPANGRVESLLYAVGEQVAEGVPLLLFNSSDAAKPSS